MQTYWRNATGTITVRMDNLTSRERERLFAKIAPRFGVASKDDRDAVARFIDRIAGRR